MWMRLMAVYSASSSCWILHLCRIEQPLTYRSIARREFVANSERPKMFTSIDYNANCEQKPKWGWSWEIECIWFTFIIFKLNNRILLRTKAEQAVLIFFLPSLPPNEKNSQALFWEQLIHSFPFRLAGMMKLIWKRNSNIELVADGFFEREYSIR